MTWEAVEGSQGQERQDDVNKHGRAAGQGGVFKLERMILSATYKAIQKEHEEKQGSSWVTRWQNIQATNQGGSNFMRIGLDSVLEDCIWEKRKKRIKDGVKFLKVLMETKKA